MTFHAWYLIVVLVAAVAVLIALINSKLRFNPFVALIVVALATGIAAGMSPSAIASSISDGAGSESLNAKGSLWQLLSY